MKTYRIHRLLHKRSRMQETCGYIRKKDHKLKNSDIIEWNMGIYCSEINNLEKETIKKQTKGNK